MPYDGTIPSPSEAQFVLGKAIRELGRDPNEFEVVSSPSTNSPDIWVKIKCKKCGHSKGRIICDWSRGYTLEDVLDLVISFVATHNHSSPVGLQGVFVAPKVISETRKFREV